MKSDLLKQIRGIFGPKKVKRNKRILIFTFFLALSTIIWFFSKLEKDYFATISVPVRFYNLPDNKIQINPLPKELNVNVFGRGFTLLRYKILSLNPVFIDLNKITSSKNENDRELIYFNSESIIPMIDREIATEVKILNIEPGNIKLIFSKKKSKKVIVVPDINYSVDKEYILDEVYVNPKYIFITGPSFIIDTLDTLFSVKSQIQNLSKDSRYLLEIKQIPLCTYSKNMILVEIKVQKKTEKTIQIPVKSIASFQTEKKEFIPATINLMFSVGLKDYKYIDANDFQFEFQKVSTPNSNNDNYFIKVISFPNNVSNIQISPSVITVLSK